MQADLGRSSKERMTCDWLMKEGDEKEEENEQL